MRRDRIEPPLRPGHDAERSFRADDQVDQVATLEIAVEGVPGAVLPHPREPRLDLRPLGADRPVELRRRSLTTAERPQRPVRREEVDRFSRQEAQHYQRHIDFNKAVYAHGYPGLEQRVDRLKRDFEGFLADKDDRFRIGYIEGFESYTTQFALQILASGLYDHRRTTRAIGNLFKWHMLEEVEHRNVAFDVYEHLFGGYLHRARMCWVSQNHMFRFIADCVRLMSSVDVARHGQRCRITLRQKTLVWTSRFGMRARSMLPGYTPHRYAIPPGIAALSAHFTALAQSIR